MAFNDIQHGGRPVPNLPEVLMRVRVVVKHSFTETGRNLSIIKIGPHVFDEITKKKQKVALLRQIGYSLRAPTSSNKNLILSWGS